MPVLLSKPTTNRVTARQLATVLTVCFDGWGDISPRSIELVADGMAGDESLEDNDVRLDSIALARALDDAATLLNTIVSAPPPRLD